MKKFISVALAICLLLSCFTVISVSAAETGKSTAGGQTISIDVSNCDTPDVPTSWYIWSWPDGSDGRLISGHGESAENVYFDDCDDNIVVVRCPWGETPNENWSNVWNQSGDERIQGSHATVYWGDGDGAQLKVVWGGDSGGYDDGGNTGYDDGGNTGYDTPSTGSYTAYLNPGSFGSGEDWYAWTWNAGGSEGSWVSGSDEGGKVRFDGLCDTVIFASAYGYPETDWSNVNAQTGDLSTMDGRTFTITGTGMGEYRASYEGDWGDGSNDDPYDNPGDDPWSDPEPVTDPWVDPTPSTEPYTDPVVYPTSAPAVNPTAAPADNINKNSGSNGSLTAKIQLNGEQVKSVAVTTDEITVSYPLNCSVPLVDAQATLYYDNTKLQIVSWSFPVIDNVVIDNLNATPNAACFNFSSPVKPFDFSGGKVLVSARFKVISGASGDAAVNLQIEELDSEDTVFAANSVITYAGSAIINSLRNVTVSNTGASINTDKTNSSNGKNASASSSKKKNTITIKAKKKVVKASKLRKKKVAVKPLTIKNAKGKVKVKKIKSGSSKKIYKKVKVNSKTGKLTLKKGKYKKGTYKLKLRITASGNSGYKSATKTKVVKIKIK